MGEGESLELREVFHNCPPHLYLDHYPSHHHHHYILWGKENLLSWERFVAKLGIAVLIIMYIVHPSPPPPHLYAHFQPHQSNQSSLQQVSRHHEGIYQCSAGNGVRRDIISYILFRHMRLVYFSCCTYIRWGREPSARYTSEFYVSN